MGVLTRAKKRRLLEDGDRIGGLPDDVLRDIVSRLPTKDGARTQALSSRWRHIWRSTPLNLAPVGAGIPVSDVHRILSAHPGPGRRFSMPAAGCYLGYDDDGEYTDTTLDDWLRSPALDGLEELQFHHNPRVPMPPSVQRFSSTLAAATFAGCGFPDEDYGGDPLHLHLPHLQRLTLADVSVSGRSLHALLAGCPVLESLLLAGTFGSPRLKITCPRLRCIDVESCSRSVTLQHLIVEDAPCLERLLYAGRRPMDISVISAPRLAFLGKLYGNNPRI